MPLRPIDAIFVHPKERYYVIYQNGDLYRLTRMKLDFESWTRRTPYTDNIEHIYLTKSQTIHDAKLKHILKTYDLPPNLHGCNLTFFLGWWESNGYIYTKDNATNTDIITNKNPQKPTDAIEGESKANPTANMPTQSDTSTSTTKISQSSKVENHTSSDHKARKVKNAKEPTSPTSKDIKPKTQQTNNPSSASSLNPTNSSELDATAQTRRQQPEPVSSKADNLPNNKENYQTIAKSDTMDQNSSSLDSVDQNGSSADAAFDDNTDDLFDSLLEDLSNEVNSDKN